ncbi:MAG: T9SS type A sorting domain-containing protein [Calditrichales bacterium]|nr:MAG: T9SS type A sorting domain-containing protein [Calditrichales bacterium]
MRSKLIISLFSFLIFLHPSTSHAESKSAYLINGHKYDMEQDLFFRAVQEWYDAGLDSVGLGNRVDSLARANNLTITELNIPRDIELVYLDDSTGINDIAGKILIAPWSLKATGLGCDFVCPVSEMGIYFKANSEFISGNLIITDIETEIFEATVEATGSGGPYCPVLADTIRSFLISSLRDYLQVMAQAFADVGTSGLFDILSPLQSFQLDDPDLIAAALYGFPLDMKIYTLYDPDIETTQLITEINFLTGTTTDRNAFSEIEPANPVAPGISYGGFSYLYWMLQRGFPWHADWSESQRVDAAFTIMGDRDIRDYRLEFRWRDLQKKIYRGTLLHPDSLTLNSIDPLLTDVAYWDTSAFTTMRNILANGVAQNLKAFMAIGVGHQDRMPEDDNGNSIAPASPEWTGPENFIPVSANEYLYNLKIYAHAVVRKFAADIDVWQIENELNAAGFAAADPQWWRKGDLWMDQEFRNRVWQTLVSAVRTEDPSARITHDLHLLGFMPALEVWIDDLDIVGVNFYPNQTTAIPVMGFMVGEYIWAVRRVLAGLGQADKTVWLIETGYPGIEKLAVADSLPLKEDRVYFSEMRQAAFIETAMNSAAINGADGFFYYSLTAQENMPDGVPDLNKFIRYSGLLRAETDEPKIALNTFTTEFNNLITGIPQGEMRNKTAHTIMLHQNYPNPFNPKTNIKFQIPLNGVLRTNSDLTTLKVYNILGEEVATLLSASLLPGSYSYEWDASNHASGVYYYQLIAGDYREVKKMVLMK